MDDKWEIVRIALCPLIGVWIVVGLSLVSFLARH